MKSIGTMSIGIKSPIIKQGYNLVDVVYDSVLKAIKENNLTIDNNDIVAVTEAILGKSQGNFATLEQISKDIKQRFNNPKTIGVVFPILSRNRFALILQAIAMSCEKVVVQLSYPKDEVGNSLVDETMLKDINFDFFNEVFTSKDFIKKFGKYKHQFTGVDYIEYYQSIIGKNGLIILSNNPCSIIKYTSTIINADIHTRAETKKTLLKAGANVLSLDDLMISSVDGSGYNSQYGLLGSNVSTQTKLKLFPKDCTEFVNKLKHKFKESLNKSVECMIYGDGAFKDPVGGIWELADPVVSPGYTDGLIGTKNEVKLKFVADNLTSDLSGKNAEKMVKKIIKTKEKNLINKNESLGTTPRRNIDLLGSLSDLTSGSGDKGTPIVLIKNYFDTYAD